MKTPNHVVVSFKDFHLTGDYEETISGIYSTVSKINDNSGFLVICDLNIDGYTFPPCVVTYEYRENGDFVINDLHSYRIVIDNKDTITTISLPDISEGLGTKLYKHEFTLSNDETIILISTKSDEYPHDELSLSSTIETVGLIYAENNGVSGDFLDVSSGGIKLDFNGNTVESNNGVTIVSETITLL